MANVTPPVHATTADIGQIKKLKKQLERIVECIRTDKEGCFEQLLVESRTGTSIEIPVPLLDILIQAMTVLAEGGAVAVMPYHAKLTTQEAADYLGVSRPYFISLLDEGVIPYERLRSHRRILLSDVQLYRQQRDGERRAALDEMARESYARGLYDLPDEADDLISGGHGG